MHDELRDTWRKGHSRCPWLLDTAYDSRPLSSGGRDFATTKKRCWTKAYCLFPSDAKWAWNTVVRLLSALFSFLWLSQSKNHSNSITPPQNPRDSFIETECWLVGNFGRKLSRIKADTSAVRQGWGGLNRHWITGYPEGEEWHAENKYFVQTLASITGCIRPLLHLLAQRTEN